MGGLTVGWRHLEGVKAAEFSKEMAGPVFCDVDVHFKFTVRGPLEAVGV